MASSSFFSALGPVTVLRRLDVADVAVDEADAVWWELVWRVVASAAGVQHDVLRQTAMVSAQTCWRMRRQDGKTCAAKRVPRSRQSLVEGLAVCGCEEGERVLRRPLVWWPWLRRPRRVSKRAESEARVASTE